jgi:NADPH:quinone reductase-like Zn-dependent oxidoreductase
VFREAGHRADLAGWEAAALPSAAVTAWNALTTDSALRPGATVLTFGTGAVSPFVPQFAKLAGARVIVTTSRAAKADRFRALGADEVIARAASAFQPGPASGRDRPSGGRFSSTMSSKP